MARLIALCVLMIAGPAFAKDKAAATVAFAEGKRLMAAGKFSLACPLFQLSYDEDPQLGTLLNLGDCHEKTGKLATAWAEFGEAIELARTKRDSRGTYAKKRRKNLAARLSYVTLRKSRADTLQLRFNGRDVTMLANIPIPVDQGTHTITVTVGGETTIRTLTIEHDATRLRVDVPFDPDEDGDGDAAAAADTAPVPVSPDDDDVDDGVDVDVPDTGDDVSNQPIPDDPAERSPAPRRPGVQKHAGVAFVVIGLASIGVGSYFGVRAYSKWSDSRDLCSDTNRCTADGRALIDQSQSAATAANFLFGGGIAAVAVGAALYLAAPSSTTVTALPVVSPTSAGAAVAVRF